jgi:hypothetical protein
MYPKTEFNVATLVVHGSDSTRPSVWDGLGKRSGWRLQQYLTD